MVHKISWVITMATTWHEIDTVYTPPLFYTGLVTMAILKSWRT